MSCKFEDICENYYEAYKCDFCHFNPEACAQDFFEWNEEGKKPTKEELEAEIQN